MAEGRGVRFLKNFSRPPEPIAQKYVSRLVPVFGFLKLFLVGSLADLSPKRYPRHSRVSQSKRITLFFFAS